MSTHATKVVRHDRANCNTQRHSDSDDCGTRYEVHCSCGFGQGAICREQADAIGRGHRTNPAAPVISWDPGPPLTAETLTDQDLRDLFARHCECRPLDLERGENDHAAIHDCDKEILSDIQIALYDDRTLSRQHSGDVASMKRDARARCAEFINEQRKGG